MRFSYLFMLLFSLPAFAENASMAKGGKVSEYMLDNGMQVIVKEDHRAPIAVSQVWYKVGSSYEPDGITGISHALEHMMFKGTKDLAPGEFSRIIAANGGRENAFTGRDYTAYFQTMSADRMEISFKLEADRMRNLLLPAEEFKKELEVVKEERRLRTEDNPVSLTREQFNAVSYRSLPYAHPIIGWMNDLNNMKVEDLRTWYRQWYAPNNATLVVVGDVKPEWVLRMAKKHFGPLKAEQTPQLKPLREPPQRGVIRTTVRAPARQPHLMLGYKTPVIATADAEWEPYAMEMLVAILDGGSSSRISKKLVRGQEIAVSAGAGYSAFSKYSGMLSMSGIPTKGHTVQDLEKALRAEIDLLKKEPVNPEELQRVQAQVVASQVYELDSVYYQAMQIGILETIGLDWRLVDSYPEKMRAVTAEQVQAVAKKYLTDDSLTIAVLDPLPLEQKKQQRASSGGSYVH
jgi:zinc protease